MSTIQVGDAFEAKSYELILKALNNGELGISKDYVRPFTKRAYYSDVREKDIIFDLALELWPPNSQKSSITYIIECKNYSNKKVPVDDVEEFYSKYTQLKGQTIKGVMISNNSFQSGAMTFAKNKGIMLIEVDSEENHSIILHKAERSSDEAVKDDQIISALLNSALGIVKIEGLDMLSAKDIEIRVQEILSNVNMKSAGEDILQFIEYMKKDYGLEVDFESELETVNGKQLLGYCDIKKKKIFINNSISMKERFSFVFGHELGHFFLHQNLKINQELYNDFEDSEYNFFMDRHEFKNPKHWIEWQANKFSALLLLPEREFLNHLMGYRKSIGISTYRHIYLDKQPVNQKDYYDTLKYLSEHFGVSKTSIIYRIEELKLITYAGGKWESRDMVRNAMFE